ncbi:MAG: ankyrin repeat domain-containing protein [Pseudomonadota bacterium]
MSPLDPFRRKAKKLRRAFYAGEDDALARVQAILPGAQDLRHTQALHIVAREAGAASWPKLKLTHEIGKMTRADRAERLKMALYFGQHWVVDALMSADPTLEEDNLGLQIALYREDRVADILHKNPESATQIIGIRSPILHLAFSRHHQADGVGSEASVAIAEMLIAHGADANDTYPAEPGSENMLSALYGALGHANNMPLARWLLEHGANPDDGESLYHSTELGHAEGLRLLLDHGANPAGTNALKRAMDFDSLEMVQMLLDAGSDPNEGHDGWTTLHHAALRQVSAPVCQALLDAGADASKIGNGINAFAAAKVYGHQPLIDLLDPLPLSPEEELLARAAKGDVPDGVYIDPGNVPPIYLDLIFEFGGSLQKLDHIKALVKVGLPWDRGGGMGVTPVQIAGWQGLPEMMAYFLSLGPDLTHINGYGGTLLSTIVHGSENNPERAGRDFIGCARLALEHGVALPRRAPEFAGEPEMAVFLADWAEAHPGQVVEGGVV